MKKKLTPVSLQEMSEEDQMSNTSEKNGLDEYEKTQHLKVCTMSIKTQSDRLSELTRPKKWTFIGFECTSNKGSLIQQRRKSQENAKIPSITHKPIKRNPMSLQQEQASEESDDDKQCNLNSRSISRLINQFPSVRRQSQNMQQKVYKIGLSQFENQGNRNNSDKEELKLSSCAIPPRFRSRQPQIQVEEEEKK